MVARQVFAEVPPRVEYSLTPIGIKFKPVLDQIQIWGMEYMAEREHDGTAEA